LFRVGGACGPPAASRCSARMLAARSFPRRPPAYVLPRGRRMSKVLPPEPLLPESLPPEALLPKPPPPEPLPPDRRPPESLSPEALPPDRRPPESLSPEALPPDRRPPESLSPESLPPEWLLPESLPPESLPPDPSRCWSRIAQSHPTSISRDAMTLLLRSGRGARTRGVAAGRSAQRACERSSDWRRGAAGSPDPEHLLGSTDPDHLLGSTDPELLPGSPDPEHSSSPETETRRAGSLAPKNLPGSPDPEFLPSTEMETSPVSPTRNSYPALPRKLVPWAAARRKVVVSPPSNRVFVRPTRRSYRTTGSPAWFI
jgi:hypothetical protein